MNVFPLVANHFRSDGGAMFGLVPKALWSRICPADDNNLIAQRTNVLLIQHPAAGWGLLDTGCGTPEAFSEKERALHGLDDTWLLQSALRDKGLGFGDIRWIALTHAHWDHAGGLFLPDGSAAFPNAEIHLFQTERDLATGGDPLLYKSYPKSIAGGLRRIQDRLRPVKEPGTEILPGIRLESAAGHTAGQACIRVERPVLPGLSDPAPPALLFTGDNCPTRHHLRMVFQTAYDTLPLETRAWKQKQLPICARDKIPLFFSHDADTFGAWIEPDSKREYVTTRLYPS
ncbi:MAG: MBL fold metallo-hydrolase [Verrucomicrobia bacterium]|nr:MBL fold metallo-hydrolase [Verrucomicrobiota bacterium]MCH8527787.1 MBL fold metallo-hydrolase [Kiritimatiellia bacterium]